MSEGESAVSEGENPVSEDENAVRVGFVPARSAHDHRAEMERVQRGRNNRKVESAEKQTAHSAVAAAGSSTWKCCG